MGVILPNIFREINHQLEYYPGRKGGELGVDTGQTHLNIVHRY
jgi:hypothetical protein